VLAELESDTHPQRERELLPRLHADEQARYQGFSVARRRESWLAGRALLLTALEQVTGEAEPVALRTADSGGVSYDAAPVHINLSHSGELLAAAVASHPVGVDIERRRARAVATQAARVFCPDEARKLEAEGESGRLALFYELWTLKEAACKAAGLSIWDGLGNACFDLDSGRCRLTAPFPAGPWHLMHAEFADDWHLAVAVRGSTGLEVQCRRLDGQGTWAAEALTATVLLHGDGD
jgi:4'-phosphopantetheinyl transferase